MSWDLYNHCHNISDADVDTAVNIMSAIRAEMIVIVEVMIDMEEGVIGAVRKAEVNQGISNKIFKFSCRSSVKIIFFYLDPGAHHANPVLRISALRVIGMSVLKSAFRAKSERKIKNLQCKMIQS